jgi:TonB family protein
MPSSGVLTSPSATETSVTDAIQPLAATGWHRGGANEGQQLPWALRWSALGHALLVLIMMVFAYFVPKPPTPRTADMTFTLVTKPSKIPPVVAQAKGNQAQLAGGSKVVQRAALAQRPPHPHKVVLPKAMPITPLMAMASPKIVEAPKPEAKPKPTVIPDKPKKPPEKPTEPKPLLNDPSIHSKEDDDTRPSDVTTQAHTPARPPTETAGQTGSATGTTTGTDAQSAAPGSQPDAQLAVSQDKLAPYMASLKTALTQRWQPPRGEQSLRVVVEFTVLADGTLQDVVVKTSSGNPETDAAAIKAVEASSPLQPLPTEWNVPQIPIRFTFDYTIFGKSRYNR